MPAASVIPSDQPVCGAGGGTAVRDFCRGPWHPYCNVASLPTSTISARATGRVFRLLGDHPRAPDGHCPCRPERCQPGSRRSVPELVQGIDDLMRVGSGGVIGMDVYPPSGVAGVQDDGGGQRQGDGGAPPPPRKAVVAPRVQRPVRPLWADRDKGDAALGEARISSVGAREPPLCPSAGPPSQGAGLPGARQLPFVPLPLLLAFLVLDVLLPRVACPRPEPRAAARRGRPLTAGTAPR